MVCAGLTSTLAAQNSSLLHATPRGNVVPSGPISIAQLPQPQSQPRLTPNQTVPLADAPESPERNSGAADDRPPVILSGASWTYQPAPPTRVFRVNDVVTIRVDEITRVAAEGRAEQRKRTLYEAIITDWVRLTDFRLIPDPQTEGDPSLGTESTSNYLADSNIESRESMAFNIAAKVVDVRPNGNMVLEARKLIRVNDNLWETSLTGICRAADIAPDNIILSKDLIDLEIIKQDRGHLRDTYSRGWFQRWLDRLQPF